MNLSAKIALIYLLIPVFAWSQQECNYTLTGKVTEQQSGDSLAYATITIKETGKGALTDEYGNFVLKDICKGNYTLVCSYLGYDSLTVALIIHKDTYHEFKLLPEGENTEVVVKEKKSPEQKTELVTQDRDELTGRDLDRTRGLTLGESLKSIPGVSSLQTGPSISKPIIHGLHSNRVLLLNNGVRQEGQQWGSEHAPEIDPFIATKISVIKGAAGIRYGSDAIGGVILVEPKALPSVPGVKGELNLAGMSNGRLGASSLTLEGAFDKKLKGLSWRVQGTARRAGNSKTAHYYMENTAFKEENFSTTLNYNRGRYGAELYFSQFYTKLGIFSGSIVGSIADLQQALKSPVPVTPSYFSYTIGRPYQQVTHDLFKAKAFYKFKNKSRLEFTYAWQRNRRYEYDYPYLNGSTAPALYLQIVTQTTEGIWYHNPFKNKNMSGSIGINTIVQGNIREYQFIIPNFYSYGGGAFIIEKWKKNRLTIEGGLRYDYRWLQAYMINNTTAQEVAPIRNFSNPTAMLGMLYHLRENLTFNANLGTAWRAPSAYELYANGVHQSAASYDIGDPNLKAERAYNFNAALNYSGKKLYGEIGFYNNQINNYIYSKPDLEYLYTIRGAFPEFTYTQVNARFRGLDIKATYVIVDSLTFTSKTSLLWAYNQSIHNYLIFAPPNRYENSIHYNFGNLGKLQGFYINVANIYVIHQWRVPPNSDYTTPPGAYTLFNADFGFDVPVGKHTMNINFSATNFLNRAYRDYLNRYRYFTDDIGRSFILRIKIPFTILSNKQ